MTDNNVLKLSQPAMFSDPLTEVLRSGARSLLVQAVEAAVAGFLGSHTAERTDEGRQRLVRHGHLPEREIMTGIGPVAVRAPRVRDCTGLVAERTRFIPIGLKGDRSYVPSNAGRPHPRLWLASHKLGRAVVLARRQ